MAKTKNTHAFQSDIKHYDKIRDILRYLYMYGSSSKEELEKKSFPKALVLSMTLNSELKTILMENTFRNTSQKRRAPGRNIVLCTILLFVP